MSQPTKSDGHSTAFTNPCVCCKELRHDGIADRDLDGYVCRFCARHINNAVNYLNKAEIIGCTKIRR